MSSKLSTYQIAFFCVVLSSLLATQAIAQDATIIVGGTFGDISWPGAEGPENAINQEGQKYLNFLRENSGFLIRPEGPNASDVPTSITLWTANDAEPRDPASFELYGSNNPDLLAPFDYFPQDQIDFDLFFEIASGELDLPSSRNDGGNAFLDDDNSQTLQFNNSRAYDHYLVLFPEVKNGGAANSMQIAEVQLNYDGFDLDSGIFDINDEIAGVGLIEGTVDPPVVDAPIRPINVSNYEVVIGSSEADPVRWPSAETPENAIDGEGQKYLNFEKENSGILIRAEGLNADLIPTSITFWTANDAVPRDPASFRLFGTNEDEVEFPLDYDHEDTVPLDLFTEIAFGELQLPDSRNQGGNAELDDNNSQTIEFENNEQYESYLIVFPTLKDTLSANSMQIAEIQMNYDGFNVEDGIFDPTDEIIGVALFELENICNSNTLGDLDGSGEVDFSDFLALSTNFGNAVASHQEGDVDCNGTVEFADFLILSANFGQAVGTSPVPEPNTSALLTLAMIGALTITRRRRG